MISTKELCLIHNIFQKVDLDHSGAIDVVELLTIMDVERTPFTERVFRIFDEDKSGKVDFYEFVVALWNYCTLSPAALAMFAFDLYDRDTSGFLEEKDISLMMRDIYGKDAHTNPNVKQ
jgi:serine/threonine-protein phosphatase 2B regulatory subunit